VEVALSAGAVAHLGAADAAEPEDPRPGLGRRGCRSGTGCGPAERDARVAPAPEL